MNHHLHRDVEHQLVMLDEYEQYLLNLQRPWFKTVGVQWELFVLQMRRVAWLVIGTLRIVEACDVLTRWWQWFKEKKNRG